jgi:hypothetical protein
MRLLSHPGLPVPPSAHRALIARVQRAQRRVIWTEFALGAGAVTVLLGVAAGFVALSNLHVAQALLLLAPTLGLVGLALGVQRARRVVGDDRDTARFLGQRVPSLSLNLLGAVELEGHLPHTKDFSPALAQAYVAQVEQASLEIDPRKVVDRRHLPWAALAFSGAIGVLLLSLALGPKPFLGRLFKEEAASTAIQVREPITGEITLAFHFPAYTGLTPRTLEGTSGEISAPEGTHVEWRARSDRPVEKAALLFNGKAVPLSVENKRNLSGTFVVEKSGTYAVAFLSNRDKEVARGPDTPVQAEPDAAPKVSLLLPSRDLEVDPGQDVLLKYEASDDYGLTALALVYRVEGKAESRQVLPLEPGRRVDGQLPWALSTLHLSPGDKVDYYLEALDNNALRGAQKGVSRTQTLRVYSAVEHRRAALAKVKALWERMLTQLANRLEGPDREGEDAKQEAILSQESVDEAGRQLAEDFRVTARALDKERERLPTLTAGLLNIGASLKATVENTSQTRTLFLRYHARAQGFGKRLARAVEQEISELEKDALYLESLLDRQRLQELKELSAALARERRELTSLLEQYQKSHDPALQKELLARAAGLKRQLEELLNRMAELGQQSIDQHVNLEALSKMAKEKSLAGQMDKLTQALEQGKTEDALLQLQKLASSLDKMQQGFDQAQKGQSKLNPELVQKFKQFASELEKTEAEQKDVAEKTKALRDRYRDDLKSRLAKLGGEHFKDQLRRDVDALQKDYQSQAQSPEALSLGVQESLSRAQEELKTLRNALDVPDYGLADESADRAVRDAQNAARGQRFQAQRDLYFQNPEGVQRHSQELADKLNQDAAKAMDISQRLAKLFPSTGSSMSEADRKKLEQLGQRQHELSERSKGLSQKMEELNQLAPVMGEEGTQKMQQISQQVGEADQRLQQRDMQRGHNSQEAALRGLEQLKQQMQQSGGGQGGEGLPMPMMAGGSPGESEDESGSQSREKIEIPDEPFQGPKELRKDLMDAMKQAAPERYRDQVKQYYEELVK